MTKPPKRHPRECCTLRTFAPVSDIRCHLPHTHQGVDISIRPRISRNLTSISTTQERPPPPRAWKRDDTWRWAGRQGGGRDGMQPCVPRVRLERGKGFASRTTWQTSPTRCLFQPLAGRQDLFPSPSQQQSNSGSACRRWIGATKEPIRQQNFIAVCQFSFDGRIRRAVSLGPD